MLGRVARQTSRWRASDQLPWIRVQAGVELPGYRTVWPEIARPAARRGAALSPAPALRSDFDSERTAMIDI
jgi:hypothetical protein